MACPATPIDLSCDSTSSATSSRNSFADRSSASLGLSASVQHRITATASKDRRRFPSITRGASTGSRSKPRHLTRHAVQFLERPPSIPPKGLIVKRLSNPSPINPLRPHSARTLERKARPRRPDPLYPSGSFTSDSSFAPPSPTIRSSNFRRGRVEH